MKPPRRPTSGAKGPPRAGNPTRPGPHGKARYTDPNVRPSGARPLSQRQRDGGSADGRHRSTTVRDEASAAPRRPTPAGYGVRVLAARIVSGVIEHGHALDDVLAQLFATKPASTFDPRDRALARLIATTVLRREGELKTVLGTFIERPLPDERGLLAPILLCAAAELLVLGIAPHATINVAVEHCRRDAGSRRFDKLANAVLRRTSERGAAILQGLSGARLNVPTWMWDRWVSAYGEEKAARIAAASITEPALDITLKSPSEASAWAERLEGIALPTGSIRLTSTGRRIDELPGFADGMWWVQDAAAALPARLLGDVAGLRIADLCAAPGGKTAQLAAMGARVTAVDASARRLDRVRENLARLRLDADLVAADALTWQPEQQFDAVLLDAPCTATGTIRRHPDILHLKRATDLAQLAGLQARLLDKAFAITRPGGTLVYCTCSLEPEEGERQIEAFLARTPDAERKGLTPASMREGSLDPSWITAAGDLRTLPFHLPREEPTAGGMDGFYAAVITRKP